MPERITRTRRSCLAVPASNPRMLEKAQGLQVDEIFFDLEDAVAPSAKDEARANAIEWLNKGDWTGKTMVVRINGVQTDWCYKDIVELVSGAGDKLDCIMIPKPESAHQVQFVEDLVRMVENDNGISTPIGFELIIESAAALTYIDEIATASDRIETLIFGYADMSASLGLPAIPAGSPMPGYPGDHLHAGLFQVIVAARTFGLQAIDGPFVAIQDIDGLRERAIKSKGLGYEGKWALHPGQIEVLHEVFTPTQEEFNRAEAIIERYEQAKAEGLGAVMFMKDMLDEAVLKQAQVVTGRGRASGLERTKQLQEYLDEYDQMMKDKAGK
ncbi:MAG: CoA ester lyase [Actinomycetota bacterium]